MLVQNRPNAFKAEAPALSMWRAGRIGMPPRRGKRFLKARGNRARDPGVPLLCLYLMSEAT